MRVMTPAALDLEELGRLHGLVMAALVDIEEVEANVARGTYNRHTRSPELEFIAGQARERLAELETLLVRAVKGARDG